jgi:hypothetical protein
MADSLGVACLEKLTKDSNDQFHTADGAVVQHIVWKSSVMSLMLPEVEPERALSAWLETQPERLARLFNAYTLSPNTPETRTMNDGVPYSTYAVQLIRLYHAKSRNGFARY